MAAQVAPRQVRLEITDRQLSLLVLLTVVSLTAGTPLQKNSRQTFVVSGVLMTTGPIVGSPRPTGPGPNVQPAGTVKTAVTTPATLVNMPVGGLRFRTLGTICIGAA